MTFYILYRIGIGLVMCLPLGTAYALAYTFAMIKYALSPRDRRNVLKNLRIILKDKSKKEVWDASRLVFINFAKYLVDFFRFSRINGEFLKKKVTLKDIHYIDEALKSNKGVIILSAHLGNWELGGVIMGLLGYDISVVALNHSYKKTNDFFISQREMKGVRVIPVGTAVRKCFGALKRNAIIAIVGDRDFTNGGVSSSFFGKTALIPKGPASFSVKTGAPIVPAFCIRNPDDTFTFYFDKPIYPKPSSDDHDDDVKSLIREYVPVMEKYISRFPEQWCLFRYAWGQSRNKKEIIA